MKWAVRPFAGEKFDSFISENNLENKPIIALLAGSRKAEITANLPTMIDAASSFTDYQLVIAGAPGISPDFYHTFISGKRVSIVFEKTYRLLQQSSAALVTSGTATLETAILKVPQVVCYKMGGGKIAYNLFKHILESKVRVVSKSDCRPGNRKRTAGTFVHYGKCKKRTEQNIKRSGQTETDVARICRSSRTIRKSGCSSKCSKKNCRNHKKFIKGFRSTALKCISNKIFKLKDHRALSSKQQMKTAIVPLLLYTSA